MKKFRSILLVIVVLIMVLSVAGCGSKQIDWDSVKREDIVAEVGGVTMSKKVVSLQYAINEYTNAQTASMFSQLGGDEVELASTMDSSFKETLVYLILAGVAEEKDMLITEEEAREIAYDDFILSAKMYSEIQSYCDAIKTTLHLSDELLVDYATEYEYLKKSAENVIKAEFEKLNAADYEDIDAMSDAVNVIITDMMKDKEVTVNYPSKHQVKGSELDFSSFVSNVKWNYSSLFY